MRALKSLAMAHTRHAHSTVAESPSATLALHLKVYLGNAVAIGIRHPLAQDQGQHVRVELVAHPHHGIQFAQRVVIHSSFSAHRNRVGQAKAEQAQAAASSRAAILHIRQAQPAVAESVTALPYMNDA